MHVLKANPDKYKGSGGLRIEHIMCGGSAPAPGMMAWYKQEYDVTFTQGWGMTEMSPMGSNGKPLAQFVDIAKTAEARFKNVAVAGLISAGVEARIVDVDDFAKRLPHDGTAQGELLVRGPWVTTRYYRIQKPEAFVEPGGWLATGDIASIDPRGNLIIRDRSKDVIKSGGEWISSIDLEKHLVGLGCFAAVAVVAQPHPKWDERPVVVGTLTAGAAAADAATQRVRDFCAPSFAKYELPDDVLIWDDLPMTGTGKIDKKQIRTMLKDQGYRLPDLRAKL